MTFDDVFNDYNDFIKSYLYREQPPAIAVISFFQYEQKIKLIRENENTASFEIKDGTNISYVVYVDKVNNDITIYVIKEEGGDIA